jgi:hypothetical protein
VKFDGHVSHLPFPDHHAPPLPLLMSTCHKIDSWLRKDPKNVAVVHCLAGKGRTGTVIAAFLIYCGLFFEADEAMNYYAFKRSFNNWGVTGPSQRRSVQYLADVITHELTPLFSPIVLSRIRIKGIPKFQGDLAVGIPPPYFIIFNNNDAINVTKLHDTRTFPSEPPVITESTVELSYEIGKVVQGDILVNFMSNSQRFFAFSDQMLGRFSLYTGMLTSLTQTFLQSEIDEANSQTGDFYPPDFQIILEFEQCPPEVIVDYEAKESLRKEEEAKIWQMKASEPRDGTICFLESQRTAERVIEARNTVSIYRGNFSEKGGFLSMWTDDGPKRLWFVLKGDRLSFYKGPRNAKSKGDIFMYSIRSVSVVESDSKSFSISKEDGQVISLSAANEYEKDQWVHAIKKLKESSVSLPNPNLDLDKLLGSFYLTLSDLSIHSLAIQKLAKSFKNSNDPMGQAEPPSLSRPSTRPLPFYCEIEYADQQQTTNIVKVSSSADSGAFRASSDFNSLIHSPLRDDKWEQSFKFLVFDQSLSHLVIRIMLCPLPTDLTPLRSGQEGSLNVAFSKIDLQPLFQGNPNFDQMISIWSHHLDEAQPMGSIQVRMKYIPSQSILSVPIRKASEPLLTPGPTTPVRENASTPVSIPSFVGKSPLVPSPSPSSSPRLLSLTPSGSSSSARSSPILQPSSPKPNPLSDFYLLESTIPQYPHLTEPELSQFFPNDGVVFLLSLSASLNVRMRKLTGRLEATGRNNSISSRFVIGHSLDSTGAIYFKNAFYHFRIHPNFHVSDECDHEHRDLFRVIRHSPLSETQEPIFSFESLSSPGCFLAFDSAGNLIHWSSVNSTSLSPETKFKVIVYSRA